MRQCKIKSGNEYDVVWLDKEVKVGDKITLKTSLDSEKLWEVITVGEFEASKAVFDSYRKTKLHSI